MGVILALSLERTGTGSQGPVLLPGWDMEVACTPGQGSELIATVWSQDPGPDCSAGSTLLQAPQLRFPHVAVSSAHVPASWPHSPTHPHPGVHFPSHPPGKIRASSQSTALAREVPHKSRFSR